MAIDTWPHHKARKWMGGPRVRKRLMVCTVWLELSSAEGSLLPCCRVPICLACMSEFHFYNIMQINILIARVHFSLLSKLLRKRKSFFPSCLIICMAAYLPRKGVSTWHGFLPAFSNEFIRQILERGIVLRVGNIVVNKTEKPICRKVMF